MSSLRERLFGKDNAHTRVGKGKVRMAHHGKTSMGLKMSLADRVKLLKSGAKDLIEGQKKDKKRKKK